MNVRTERVRSVACSIVAAGLLGAGLLSAACAVNPATGKRELSLYSESQEVAIGRQADEDIERSYGIYEDPELARYVSSMSQRLAAVSERPDLPWSFEVVDDASVNAFALPGGFIYVTRGLLVHMQSEAQLAAVIGHEIGHVTARHSVNQMSRQQIFGGLVGLGSALSPELARYGGLLETAGGLAFLKFGRDDERQADRLGMRYLVAAGYDPRPMPDVFETLRRVGDRAGAGRVPGWMSTHPDPAERRDDALARLSGLDISYDGKIVRRDAYLDRIDGLVFGRDPRDGYFDGTLYIHPRMRFAFRFPEGFETSDTRERVAGAAASGDALVQVDLADASSPDAAASAFFRSEGIARTAQGTADPEGFPARGGEFVARSSSGDLYGAVSFVAHDSKVFRLLALATASAWEGSEGRLLDALRSFRAEDDPSRIDVEPARVAVVTLERATRVRDLAARSGGVDAETLATLNGVELDATLEPGRRVKLVRGAVTR